MAEFVLEPFRIKNVLLLIAVRSGLRIVHATRFLRHSTARFEVIA